MISVVTTTYNTPPTVLARTWANEYSYHEPDAPLLFYDFHDKYASKTVFLHGRENLVLENDYLIKYKGTWGF